ncbi:MAG: TonB-dependent receptor [Pyrinomonas methylaliphatogenes]|nr:TonB-dependent receptor [Pyrinomonas methylaliphatogenes]
MLRRDFIPYAIMLALCLGGFTLGEAQNIKGSIVGRATDTNGNAIPGATVLVRDLKKELVFETLTDDTGEFRFPSLEVGEYCLEIQKEGFATFRSAEISLLVGESVKVEARLQPAEVSAMVIVKTDVVSTLTLDDAKRSRSFSDSEMNDLPVQAGTQGRNFYAQARSAPGVAFSPQAHAPFTVNGNRPRSNNYMIDSVDATDANTGLIAGRGVTEQLVSQEAIASFEIITHNFKAEHGRNSGAIVSIITKSGTDEYHGSAYWYHNDSALRARNFFENEKPASLSNLAGATLGGPIAKRRAFFFAQYEIFRVRGTQNALYQGLTAAEKAMADPHVAPLVALYPTVPSSAERFLSLGVPSATDQRTYLARGDWFINARQSLMVRINDTRADRQSFGVGNILTSRAPGERRTINATIQHTWTIRPELLLEARLGFNRQVEHDSDSPDPLFLGDQKINGEVGLLVVTGLSTLGIPSYLNQYQFQNNYQAMGDLTWTRKRHTLKFGASFRAIQVNGGNLDSSFRGQLTFNSIADFLRARPAVYTRNLGNPRIGLRRDELHAYIQDDWRATPSLALNLGLRYEINTAPREVAGRLPLQKLLRTDFSNFAPRIGLIWSPLAGMAMRAGYGIYYNVVETTFLGLTRFVPPLVTNYVAYNPTFPNLLEQARIGLPSGLVIPSQDVKTPYAEHISLGIERELGHLQSTLDISYVGTMSHHLSRTRRPNGGEQLPQARRPDPSRGVINLLETTANASYHALQIGWTRRFNSDLQVRAAYTRSKFIDEISDIISTNTGIDRRLLPLDENRLYLDRAVSDYDIPHSLSLTYIWRLRRPRMGILLKDWTISGIIAYRSGLPYTLYSGTNTPSGNNNNRLNDLPGALARDPSSPVPIRIAPGVAPSQLIPRPGSLGTLGRNTERAESFYEWNVSLQRDFPLRERLRLQMRIEVFNLFNATNFNEVDNVLSSPTFGRYKSAFDPRRAQLVLRVQF